MKTPNYQIQIAEPCHEDWNKMLPETQGKFCLSCSKAVIDFTGKTDLEIHTLLTEKKGEKVCGHFRTSQVNRPLNIRIALNDLPENMSTTKKFTLALLLVFGSMLFSFTDLKGQQVPNVQVDDREIIMGKMRCVAPVKEDQVPVKEEEQEPEPRIMGDIMYDEPEEVKDSVLEIFQEGIMLGGVSIVQAESYEPSIEGEISIQEIESPEPEFEPGISEEIPEFIIYPNPSRGDFTVKYELMKKSDVVIVLMDEKGNLVRTIVDMQQQYEGQYNIPVNTDDLPAGVYVLVSRVDERRFSNKVVVEN